MTDITPTILDFIPTMADELPAITAGEETSVDRLMLAATVCGWITDYPDADDGMWGRNTGIENWPNYTSITAHSHHAGEDTAGYIVTEWKDGQITQAIDANDLTSDELADIGRSFLNAAIRQRRTEKATNHD